MRQRAVKTLFEGKKQRLERTLDWIEKHCSKQQKDEVNQILDDYPEFLISFPDANWIRCSHEVDKSIIKTPKTEDEINQLRPSDDYDLDEEIENRKGLINGLIMELEELKEIRGSIK